MELMHHSSSFLRPAPEQNGDLSSRLSPNYALVLLNQCLPRFTPLLWNHAQIRVCADGGANRLFDELPSLFPKDEAFLVRKKFTPDVIKGDMDSIRVEVLDFYTSLGTRIVDESHDQDTTDLHKCIVYIRDCTPTDEKENLRIIVTGALGGRFDHEAGNINVLYAFPSLRIVLLSNDCMIYLLPKNHKHEIVVDPSVEGPHCGLIPIGGVACRTTTSGLQWNLDEMEMRFGGLVSTSNIVQEERVIVESSSDLLWTISIKPTICLSN